MAIHADYPGLTVEIYVDGKPLEEYKNPEEEDVPKTTTRYVECRSGAEFAIKTNFRPPFAPMDITIGASLDGTRVSNRAVHKQHIMKKTYNQSCTRWKEDGASYTSNFLFSDFAVGK